MYLWSSALIFYIDSDFPLGHMSMDVSSVLAALSSHGVPWVTGTNIQVASPRGCTPGLAGSEPSGTFIHPGQHLHGSTGYLNVVPAGPIPSLAPQGIPVNPVGPQEIKISPPPVLRNRSTQGIPLLKPTVSQEIKNRLQRRPLLRRSQWTSTAGWLESTSLCPWRGSSGASRHRHHQHCTSRELLGQPDGLRGQWSR